MSDAVEIDYVDESREIVRVTLAAGEAIAMIRRMLPPEGPPFEILVTIRPDVFLTTVSTRRHMTLIFHDYANIERDEWRILHASIAGEPSSQMRTLAVGGQPTPLPRSMFVPLRKGIQCVEEFIASHRLSPDLFWLPNA